MNTADNWIDSRVQLPEEGQSVWVFGDPSDNGYDRVVSGTFFRANRWKDDCLWLLSHLDQLGGHHLWQPLTLPEPPAKWLLDKQTNT